MDPVTLVVTALVAGASAGLQEATSSAVKEAYLKLKALVGRHFGDRMLAQAALEGNEQSPTKYERPLAEEVTVTHAADDPEVRVLAQELLDALEANGTPTEQYVIQIEKAIGVQIGGRGNTQYNRGLRE